jgi:hypothetical protein
MSASAPAAEPCAECGAELPAGARFCPACGQAVVAAGWTVREPLPPNETGRVPVHYQQAETRWFGVPPQSLLLGLAGGALVLAIVLFATGHWPFGLILLGIGALLAAAFLEAARRRPSKGFAHATLQARERAYSTMETWRARSFAANEARRIRRSLALLEADRRTLLLDLGVATHAGDAAAEAGIRARLTELDGHERDLHAHLEQALAFAGERIRQARLPVQDTMMVLPGEPTPPPGEATPPQPAVVPEPYPPPDEATPPEPARIPEPTPDPPDPDPERSPEES